MKTLISWSGGKDSCFAMMQAVDQGCIPKVLLNMMNENGEVSRSHGIPLEVLELQAQQMKLPLKTVPATWSEYEEKFIQALKELKCDFGIEATVFGDIDLEPHREWEEKVCAAASLKTVLPLWQQNRLDLVNQMLNSGIKTMIVSCNSTMGEAYLGKILTSELAKELESKGIDPCGENGEFHTLVIDCPLFEEEIQLPTYKTTTHNNYCFIVWDK